MNSAREKEKMKSDIDELYHELVHQFQLKKEDYLDEIDKIFKMNLDELVFMSNNLQSTVLTFIFPEG